MSRSASKESLSSLMKKARTRLDRYEGFRADGNNAAADKLIPEMFELRKRIISAYRDALDPADPAAGPTRETTDEMHFLIRALAPGIARPARQKRVASPQRSRDPGKVSTELLATALRRRPRGPRKRER